ncbi:MAG: matrixin family metalloprotease [Candidatus Pacearchaeota archaeon]
MKKPIILVISILILSVSFVLAWNPNFQVAEVVPSDGHAIVRIPENAVQVAPGIFSLGISRDVDGSLIEGYAIVKYKKGFEHKSTNKQGGFRGNELTTQCFSFLASGAKWKVRENYIVNPSNNVGLDELFIRSNLVSDIQEWENAAGKDIFGDEVNGSVNIESIGKVANGQNEVVFGSINNAGVIAVTYVWGVFSGPLKNRRLVEWDQIYNQVDFSWNTNGNPNDMDFENIAQHELGHSFGLGHPSDSCTEETMFRFASEGETKKRDLNVGDIAGIKKLYN